MAKTDISNTYELEQKVFKFIRYGMDKSAIIKKISSFEFDKDFNINVELAVEGICEDYPDYDLIQFFMDSKIIIDRETKDSLLYLYNVKNHELRAIERQALAAFMG